jgi:CRP/FNR family transcriptional regulator, cyclic AMP receptor protein
MKSVLISEKIKSSYIRKHPLFRQLDEDFFSKVCSKAKLIKLKRKDPYLLNSELTGRIFFLGNGTAKLVRFNSLGKDTVKDILVDGEVFGDFSFIGANIDGYVTGLQVNTYMFYFTSSELKKILQCNHLMSLNYMEMISMKLRYLEARHSIWTSKDARLRLLYFFQGWASCTGIRTANSVILENYFALSDIAEFIGVTRQFMHTMLNELKEEGLLNYSRKQVEINNVFLEQDIEKQKLTG